MKADSKGKSQGPAQIGSKRAIGDIEKPRNFKQTMVKFWKYLRPHKVSLLLVILFAVGSSAFSIAGPNILRRATNALYEGFIAKLTGVGEIDFEYIANVLLVILGLYLASAVFGFVQGYIVTGIAQKVSYTLRRQISEKINRIPLSYFDTTSYGDVLSRVTNDVDTISQSLNQSLSQIISSAVTVIGVLAMMLVISWQMTLVAITIVPMSLLVVTFIVKRSQIYFKGQQKYLGKANGYVEESYSGHSIVKTFNREEDTIGEFEEINEELYATSWKAQFLSGIMMPMIHFVGNIGYVLVSIAGGWFVVRGVIMVGDILAFIQYIRSFTQPLSQMAQVANVLQSTAAAAERVFDFLEEEEESVESSGRVARDSLRGEVEFSDISFGYDKDKTIIEDFSFQVRPGQKIAIVGPTGAGKTTIIKLLMRFYDLNSGSIKVDGVDIKELKRSELRSIFGIVLQDTWLFSGSIMDNIRYGKLEASDEEVISASRSAYADHFIRTLPNGYHMEIDEEASNLSQGQKQLLTIARAILSDPKILILDEATSSVDTRTEVLIQKAMKNLMKDRTSFIIAHRLSTIVDADTILVMKDGDIIEHGSHAELMEKKGFYESLYNSQFEISDAI